METTCRVCNNVKQISKQGLSFHKLLTALRREFREQNFNLKIKTDRDKTLGDGEFYVNAYYDPEDDKNKEVPIEVVVHHHFDKDVIWQLNEVGDLLREIFDAVIHEFKHQRQSRKRKFHSYWDHTNPATDYTAYLSDPDEVDAYAVSIAIELCRNLGKYRALRYLSKISSLSRLKYNGRFVSPNLSTYVNIFGGLEDPTIRLLAKKVYVRLQKIDTDCVFV
jgi:hypothetical protein